MGLLLFGLVLVRSGVGCSAVLSGVTSEKSLGDSDAECPVVTPTLHTK